MRLCAGHPAQPSHTVHDEDEPPITQRTSGLVAAGTSDDEIIRQGGATAALPRYVASFWKLAEFTLAESSSLHCIGSNGAIRSWRLPRRLKSTESE
jgi:hypothetical protein